MVSSVKNLVGARIETTYGTDSAPGAAHAILVTNVELTPVVVEGESRNLQRGYYGNSETIPTNVHQTVSFDVELAGAGTAGDAPGYGSLLRACGLAETLVANTRAEYTPITGSEESVTLYVNRDGQLHKLLGARGTFTIEVGTNAIPYLKFAFTGLWTDPISAAAATPNFSLFQTPKHGANANTTITLHGVSPGTSALTYDHANSVAHRELINLSNEVRISERAPTGSMTFDEPSISTKNYFTAVTNVETGACTTVHGTTAGNICELSLPKVQLSEVSLGDDSGISQLQMSLIPVPTNGNDEMKLTVR